MIWGMIPSLEPFISWLTNALAGIPATFWGVVVGSFFTLLAGYVTNRSTDRRQRAQFMHEQSLKREERELALRKEIYLAAAEAIQEGAMTLSGLANMDVAIGDLTKAFLAKAPVLSKVQVVARIDTLRAVMEAGSFIGTALLRLTALRMPLDAEKQQIDALRSMVTNFVRERDRWLEEAKRYNLAGVPNERLWDTLQTNYKFEEKRIDEHQALIGARIRVLFTNQLSFAAACLDESRQLATLIVPTILAVRSELGIPSNEQEINALLYEILAKQHAATDTFLEAARVLVANLNSGPGKPAAAADP